MSTLPQWMTAPSPTTMPDSILLSRTDALGDMVLTLPMAGFIKHHAPHVRVGILCREYTAPLVRLSAHVDDVFLWNETLHDAEGENAHEITRYKSIIHVFPRKEIAEWASERMIPHRIGTSHRLYHWWSCNGRVPLGRKNSKLHEAELNLRLLEPYFGKATHVDSPHDLTKFFALTIPAITDNSFTLDTPYIIFHPFSNGSAPAYSQDNMRKVIERVAREVEPFFTMQSAKKKGVAIMLTGGKNDMEAAENLLATPFLEECVRRNIVVNTVGKFSLENLCGVIARANMLIANSTGPLHIAAAYNVPTIGLFVNRPPVHPLRWRALGQNAKTLTPPNDSPNINDIAPETICKHIFERVLA